MEQVVRLGLVILPCALILLATKLRLITLKVFRWHNRLEICLQHRVRIEHVLSKQVVDRPLLDSELPDELEVEIIDHLIKLLLDTDHLGGKIKSFLLISQLWFDLGHSFRSRVRLSSKNCFLNLIDFLIGAGFSLSTLCNSVLNYLVFID